MDGRKNNGGTKGNKGGRRPRKEDAALVKKLSKYDDVATKALIDAVKEGESWAVKLFMEYRYGKPVNRIEGNVDVDVLIDMAAWQ